MKNQAVEAPDRIPVEIPGNGGLLEVGTVPASWAVPEVDSAEWFDVHLTFKRHYGRLIGVICECASDAKRLPGFEAARDPTKE